MRRSTRAKVVGRYVSLFSRKPYEKVLQSTRGAYFLNAKPSVRKRKRYLTGSARKNIKGS